MISLKFQDFLGLLGSSWGLLGGSLGAPGRSLGSPGARFGIFFASILLDTLEHEKCPAKSDFPCDFYEISGPSWAPFGSSWGLLGPSLGAPGRFSGSPGARFGVLFRYLSPYAVPVGSLVFRGFLKTSKVFLGCSLGGCYGSWGLLGEPISYMAVLEFFNRQK